MTNGTQAGWLAAGLRTPFVAVDGPFAHRDSLALSVPVVQAMAQQVSGRSTLGYGAPWSSISRMPTWRAKCGSKVNSIRMCRRSRPSWRRAAIGIACPRPRPQIGERAKQASFLLGPALAGA